MDLTSPRIDEAADQAVESNEVRGPRFVYASGDKPLEGYTIKRGIGRGGFGEVYFAISDAGKEVALKLIRRNLDVEMRGVTHCLNLKHPNLISIYDLRTDTMGDQWVVMEYVAGESLEAAIQRHPNGMPEEEALRWIRGIGAGVAYLHDHGIVHRDLKPGNVFLDIDASDQGLVKIGDYGLSKFISCSRRSGQTESVGTVHYMAPEIANGRYGREIDTYALGIMLYEMLTGHVPFEGESVGEVLMKHLTAEPKLDNLKEPYRQIVQRTLAKDPEARIGTAQELLSLLPGASQVPPRVLPPRVTAVGQGAPKSAGATDRPGGRGGSPPPPEHFEPVREPLMASVAKLWSQITEQWHQWPAPGLGKGLALFAIVFGLFLASEVWLPILIFLAPVYLIYYLLWSILIKPGERRHREALVKQQELHAASHLQGAAPPRPAPAAPTAELRQMGKYAHAPRRQRRVDWQQRVHQELAAKPFGKLATELLGSMVVAGLACAFLALMVDLVIGAGSPADTVPLMLWTWLVSTAGTWGILATAKFTEGRVEDQIPMRVTMLVIGAAVGCFAWWLSDLLMVGLPVHSDMGVGVRDTLLSSTMGQSLEVVAPAHAPGKAMPGVVLSVLYFAALLLAGGAWGLHFVTWYPQPTGLAVAAIMAVATQISSPWFPPSRRKAILNHVAPGYGGYH